MMAVIIPVGTFDGVVAFCFVPTFQTCSVRNPDRDTTCSQFGVRVTIQTGFLCPPKGPAMTLPVLQFQIQTTRSIEPDINPSPSSENDRAVIAPVCPSSFKGSRASSPVVTSQIRILPSDKPEARCIPSRENATDDTNTPPFLSGPLIIALVDTFQMKTSPSLRPAATYSLSHHATQITDELSGTEILVIKGGHFIDLLCLTLSVCWNRHE